MRAERQVGAARTLGAVFRDGSGACRAGRRESPPTNRSGARSQALSAHSRHASPSMREPSCPAPRRCAAARTPGSGIEERGWLLQRNKLVRRSRPARQKVTAGDRDHHGWSRARAPRCPRVPPGPREDRCPRGPWLRTPDHGTASRVPARPPVAAGRAGARVLVVTTPTAAPAVVAHPRPSPPRRHRTPVSEVAPFPPKPERDPTSGPQAHEPLSRDRHRVAKRRAGDVTPTRAR